MNDKQQEFKQLVADENRKIRQNKAKMTNNLVAITATPHNNNDNKVTETSSNNNQVINDNNINSVVRVTPIPIQINNNRNTWNELESYRLMELFNAINEYKYEFIESNVEITTHSDMSRAICMKYEGEVKTAIRLSKRLKAYDQLCDDDKIELVKYGYLDIFLLRSVLTFNFQTQYIELFMVIHRNMLINPHNIVI